MEAMHEFCLIGSCTNTGRVRTANEDSTGVFDTPNGKAVIVCDGMGGHVGGQIASQVAVAAIGDFLGSHLFPDPREAVGQAILAASRAIANRVQAQPELAGMGATCVLLLVTGEGKAYYGHVGDSRIYFIANRMIRQLTKDHSFVQMLVDSGEITPEQAERHPRRNEITNALGLSAMQPPTVCREPVEPEAGNCFLLCSDGLTGMVGDDRIMRIVSKHDRNIRLRAEQLVRMANEAGGTDNITVQLVEFALSTSDISGAAGTDRQRTRARKGLLTAVIGTALTVLGITAGYLIGTDRFNFRPAVVTPAVETAAVETAARTDTVVHIANPILYGKGTSVDIVLFEAGGDSIRVIDSPQPDGVTIRIADNSRNAAVRISWTGDFDRDRLEFTCRTERHATCTVVVPVILSSGKTPQPARVAKDSGKPTGEEVQYINSGPVSHARYFTEIFPPEANETIRYITDDPHLTGVTIKIVYDDEKYKTNFVRVKWTDAFRGGKVEFGCETDRNKYTVHIRVLSPKGSMDKDTVLQKTGRPGEPDSPAGDDRPDRNARRNDP
ncbi:MAG: Stp1/IreP family PP2C-type Ser/Thr phosphatase [Tannerella sp.]|jgi:protein phosphatase|nr:Stp1/IreP family PP2C-type Ser/Thr phosphatase [Tannerella sp.]